MQKQYKARQPVGRFNSGDIVGGLSEFQIQDLLQRGVIEAIVEIGEVDEAVKAKSVPANKKEVKTNGE